CVKNDRRHVRGRVAGPRYEVTSQVECDEIFIAGVSEGNVAPKLPAAERANRAGQFVALGADFAGESTPRRAYRHIDIAPDDVVSGERPLRPVVPQHLLDAGLVNGRAGQGQRYRGVD